MSKIYVQAVDGLLVPTEHNPREYIGQEPVEVDADSLYYQRIIADGDLLVVDAPAKAKGAKS